MYIDVNKTNSNQNMFQRIILHTRFQFGAVRLTARVHLSSPVPSISNIGLFYGFLNLHRLQKFQSLENVVK
jgi:hypothetical protein